MDRATAFPHWALGPLALEKDTRMLRNRVPAFRNRHVHWPLGFSALGEDPHNGTSRAASFTPVSA